MRDYNDWHTIYHKIPRLAQYNATMPLALSLFCNLQPHVCDIFPTQKKPNHKWRKQALTFEQVEAQKKTHGY